MKIRVLADSRSSQKALRKLCSWADEIRFAYAWMGQGEPWLTLDEDKVNCSVVGTHFLGTDPEVLQFFLDYDGGETVRVAGQTTGTFHPKIILGIRGEKTKAIVGSSNFTAGGFGANTELNLQLSGKSGAPALKALAQFVETQWAAAVPITADWLEGYRQRFAEKPKPPKSPKATPAVEQSHELDVGWDTWFDLLTRQFDRQAQGMHSVPIFSGEDSYLSESQACAEAFKGDTPFAQMHADTRRLLVGGTGSSGYFGGAGASGKFMSMVINRPEALGRLIDQVPLTGEVGLETAETFLKAALAIPSVGMAGATRLLAMKRPDRFLSINGGNRPRIKEVFGFGVTKWAHYLKLHTIIWAFPWTSAAQPTDPLERQVWRARVAFLDAALYVHPG